MNTMQLECFITVADTLSFARAAERLGVSQPTVTHQIQTLEAELGCTLFNRTTRRVRLTDDGRLFYADAESMLQTFRRARGRFRSRNTEAGEPLRIGCRALSHVMMLAPVFRELARAHPNLRPDAIVIPHEHVLQLLGDGRVDVVLSYESFEGSASNKDAAGFHEIARDKPSVICPRDYELAKRAYVWPDALGGYPLALTRPDALPPQMRHVIAPILAARDNADDYLCDSAEVAITLVRAGIALSIQPALALPDMPDVAAVPLEGAERIPFGAYTVKEQESPLICEFIETLRAQLN